MKTLPSSSRSFWYFFSTASGALFFYFWILQDPQRFGLLLGPFRHSSLFLDLHCILAAIEGHARGIDVMTGFNPLDSLGRGHAYSPLWLEFRSPLLEMSNLGILGFLILVIFLIQGAWLARPTHPFQVLFSLLLLSSPAVALAVERANSDIIIFILLYLPFLIPARFSKASNGLLWTSCYTASILKYYPVAAFSLFISTLESRRSFLLATAVALLGGALFFLLFSDDLLRSFSIMARPQYLWVFGKDMMFAPFFPKSISMFFFYAFLGLLIAGATIRALAGNDLEFSPRNPKLESLFLCSSLIYILCFVGNTNFDYRLIFLIPTVPYLFWLRNFQKWRFSAGILLGCYLLIVWCEIFYYQMVLNIYGRVDVGNLSAFMIFKGFISWTILGYHLFLTAAIYRNNLGYKYQFFSVQNIRRRLGKKKGPRKPAPQ